MPHVTDKILKKTRDLGYAQNSGEFAALIAVEAVRYLKFNGQGFKYRAEVLAGLTSCLDEWRKHLSDYEDIKSLENGNIFEKLEKEML